MNLKDKERIERQAFEYTKCWGENCDIRSYIAVATAENERMAELLKQERNKVIDKCIAEIERLNNDGVLYEYTARKVLESLKSE